MNRTSVNSKLTKLAAILKCPKCRGSLQYSDNGSIDCYKCGSIGATRDNKLWVVQASNSWSQSEFASDRWFSYIKESIRRLFPRFYSAIIAVFSPVLSSDFLPRYLRSIDWSKELVVNLGSGCSNLHPDIVNIDINAYAPVNIVADITQVPFADNSIDVVICDAVIEHVQDPNKVVNEVFRVLKPKGRVLFYAPFICGIHGVPDDYQRYTPHGLEVLFDQFTERQVNIGAGPTSGLLWVLHEWLSMLLSLGNKTLYQLFYLVLLVVLAPIKLLDLILVYHPAAQKIAFGFFIAARKP